MLAVTTQKTYIGWNEAGEQLSVVRQCPVTGGRPTVMTEASFSAMCSKQQEKSSGWKYHYGKNSVSAGKKTWCDVCQGEQRPKELQLTASWKIENLQQQPKGESMATKKTVRGDCDGGCGGNGLLVFDVDGVTMCSACGKIHLAVKAQKDAVVTAIRHTGLTPWYVQQLVGDTVTAQGTTLAAIAELVGYAGDSTDGLVFAVQAAVERAPGQPPENATYYPPDVVRALGMEDQFLAKDFELAIIQQAAQLENMEQLSAYLCLGLGEVAKLVGVDPHDFRRATLAVAQGEAIIEALGAMVGSIEPIDIIQAVSALTLAYEQRQKRVDELEYVTLINEQIFTQLREVINSDGVGNAELPGAVRAALNSAPATIARNASPQNIDSPLLDLALDVMRGDIQGLTPERISALREVSK